MNILLICCSLMILTGTLLPINNSKYWFIRAQINFRAYYLIINLLLVFLHLLSSPHNLLFFLITSAHLFCIALCIHSIYPYSFLSKKTIASAKPADSGSKLKLLIFNVYQENTEYDRFIQLVKKDAPDIILLLEPGTEWYRKAAYLEEEYPYTLREIKDDTYGIWYLSKLKFTNGKINHLVKNDIPSVEAHYCLNGTAISVYGLHPEPPIPGEALSSKPKDKELINTALKIKEAKSRSLSIVVGDLNDVGWSKTNKQFRKISGLQDPREGRGIFATFPTYLPFRIPIDNIFCHPSIKLLKLERLENIGSDHFPIFVQLLIPEHDKETENEQS